MKDRTETAAAVALPGDATLSGMRRLTLTSIALLQLTNNPYLGVMLDGDDDPHNRTEQLKFLYIHAYPNADTVINVCLASRRQPDLLTEAALRWGLDITPARAEQLILDMHADRDDIANASTEIIPESPGGSVSKNLPGHQR